MSIARLALIGMALAACSRAHGAAPPMAAGAASGTESPAQVRGVNGSVALSDDDGPLAVAADTILLAEGRQVVRTLCVACHSEQPPAKLAPPLAHISRRYRMVLGNRDSAIVRMTAWVQAPTKERALMPSMAIERFGLMAPFPIPEAQRRAAAAYVWSLSEGADSTMNGRMIHEAAAPGEAQPTAAALQPAALARVRLDR